MKNRNRNYQGSTAESDCNVKSGKIMSGHWALHSWEVFEGYMKFLRSEAYVFTLRCWNLQEA